MFNIYCLKNPDTNDVWYIGVTTTTLNSRLSQHIYDAMHKNSLKAKWIKDLLDKGKKPLIELLEICTIHNWREKEIFWISKYNNLVNSTRGGDGYVIDRKAESITRSSVAKYIPIIQLDMNGKFIKEWESATEVEKTLSILKTSLGNVLRGRTISAGGYRWVYKKEYLQNTYNLKPIKTPNCIKIYEVNSLNNIIKEYSSIKELVTELGIKYETLHKYLDIKVYKNNKMYKTKI